MSLSLLIVSFQIISAFAIIILVLLQDGKGSDIGAFSGSASSLSVFGASGSANFLSRATKYFAIIFFLSTVSISYMNNKTFVKSSASSVMYSDGHEIDTSVPNFDHVDNNVDKEFVEKKLDKKQ
ncbi:MAG: preprotein translocase subunit SecG [Candidatus Kinetoplastibacterium crithidii]|nr:MAG: preprotein translocase subunit SecG [Candidatus Kinetoplastibacterium crithidii]